MMSTASPEQYVLPTWADDMNMHLPYKGPPFAPFDYFTVPYRAQWFEFPSPSVAQEQVDFFIGRNGRYRDGQFFTSFAAGVFTCLRRLPYGPVRKLSQWDQLSVGLTILLHPTPTDQEIVQAFNRVTFLKNQRRGWFVPHVRDDGSLWLSRDR